MLFRILPKDEWKRLVEIMLQAGEVIAPKKVNTDKAGKDIHQYLPVRSVAEIDLEYETTEYSAKTYFLPYKETLSEYRFEENDWSQEIKYRLQPRAIVGLHACDINALLKLDKVFVRGLFPSPYYVSRRENTFVVGVDHDPCEGGFCRSLGTDTVTHGFDLFLTDLGDRYFVAIGSDTAYTALQQVESREIDDADTQDYLEVRTTYCRRFRDQDRCSQPVEFAGYRIRVGRLDALGRQVLELRQLRDGLPHVLLLRGDGVSVDGRRVSQPGQAAPLL